MNKYAIGVVVVLGLATALLFVWLRLRRLWLLIVILVVVFGCGSLWYGAWRAHTERDPQLARYAGTTLRMTGTIISDPQRSGMRQRFTFQITQVAIDGKDIVVHDRATVSLPRYPIRRYGDLLTIQSALRVPEPFDTEYGRTFRYDRYLQSQRIGYTVYADTSRLLATNRASVYSARLFQFKHALFASLDTRLHEPHGSIARAMVFGDQSGIPDTLEQQFQKSGLIHIMVLSGSNITIIAVALLAITQRVSKRFGIIVSAGAICAFLIMTGLTPTSLRAGVMGGIGLLAMGTFRRSDPLRALMLAAALMAVINPFVVLDSVSFQLSCLATLGLIVLTPLVTFVRIPTIFGLREIIATTIATQIAVLPILCGAIGVVSFIGIIANLFVVPLVSLVILFTVITAVSGLVYAIPLVGAIAEYLIRGIVFITVHAARVDGISLARMGAVNGYMLGTSISLIVVIALYFFRKRGMLY